MITGNMPGVKRRENHLCWMGANTMCDMTSDLTSA